MHYGCAYVHMALAYVYSLYTGSSVIGQESDQGSRTQEGTDYFCPLQCCQYNFAAVVAGVSFCSFLPPQVDTPGLVALP